MLTKVSVTLLFLVLASASLNTTSEAQTVVQEKPTVGVGAAAPDFTLVDQNGQKRTLSAERGKRPVVLVFYRGYW